MRTIGILWSFLGACAFAAGSAGQAATTAEQFQPLVAASARRIELATQVALAKWDRHAAVEDERREEQVIDSATQQGAVRGLDKGFVASFFRAQIEANKLVQYALLADWGRVGRAPQHPRLDLAQTVRPELDQIQSQLIDQLSATRELRDGQSCSTDLAHAISIYLAQHQSFTPVETKALHQALAPACILRH